MGQGILLSQEAEVDFMIHGVFSYNLFGQELWITTTHICTLIVLLVIVTFCIAANRVMKRASEVPGGFQNIVELVVEKLDGMVESVMGKCFQICKLYRYNFYFYTPEQYFRVIWIAAANGGLWSNFPVGCDDICNHPL